MHSRCHHFPACGGCSLQEITYEEQLQRKQAAIETLFPSALVSPIIQSQEPWHYRNKMEFSFSQNKAGDRFLGLILKKSKGKVFNLHECHIAPPDFSHLLFRVREWWAQTSLRAFHFRSGEGTLRTITFREARRTGQRMAILTVSGNPEFAIKQKELDQFVKIFDNLSMTVFLQIHQATRGKPTQFFEMHLAGPPHIIEELTIEGRTFQFKVSPTSFFQPNTEQAEVLYRTALSFPTFNSDSCVYDLYCGTGTIGILCATRAQQVIGIELNPHAIFDGRMNAELNRLSNVEFYQGDVAQVLAQQTLPKPSLVIIDPPRAGLDRSALEILRQLNSPEIVYISCNPKIQAQNLLELTDYHIQYVQPVDQFPHTPHIENICFLTKKISS